MGKALALPCLAGPAKFLQMPRLEATGTYEAAVEAGQVATAQRAPWLCGWEASCFHVLGITWRQHGLRLCWLSWESLGKGVNSSEL